MSFWYALNRFTTTDSSFSFTNIASRSAFAFLRSATATSLSLRSAKADLYAEIAADRSRSSAADRVASSDSRTWSASVYAISPRVRRMIVYRWKKHPGSMRTRISSAPGAAAASARAAAVPVPIRIGSIFAGSSSGVSSVVRSTIRVPFGSSVPISLSAPVKSEPISTTFTPATRSVGAPV